MISGNPYKVVEPSKKHVTRTVCEVLCEAHMATKAGIELATGKVRVRLNGCEPWPGSQAFESQMFHNEFPQICSRAKQAVAFSQLAWTRSAFRSSIRKTLPLWLPGLVSRCRSWSYMTRFSDGVTKQPEPGIFCIYVWEDSKIVLVAAEFYLLAPEGDAGVGSKPPDEEWWIQPQRSKD